MLDRLLLLDGAGKVLFLRLIALLTALRCDRYFFIAGGGRPKTEPAQSMPRR